MMQGKVNPQIDPTTPPANTREAEILLPLRQTFGIEPAVGVTIVDAGGVVRFANARAAQMCLGASPEEMIGRSLGELLGSDWADERMRVLDRVRSSGRAMLMRFVHNGVQLQTTMQMLTTDADKPDMFLMVTVEGEPDPPADAQMEIHESDMIDLGPLDPLTQRELEVLALVGVGMTSKQIGAVLFRSSRTIEQHIESIRRKLKASRRDKLMAIAQRAGLELIDAKKRRLVKRGGASADG